MQLPTDLSRSSTICMGFLNMIKLYILESINYNFILTMEGGTVKKYRNTVKQIDEVNDCNVFQKDSDKFVKVAAEAGAAKNSANDARRIPKKKLVSLFNITFVF